MKRNNKNRRNTNVDVQLAMWIKCNTFGLKWVKVNQRCGEYNA